MRRFVIPIALVTTACSLFAQREPEPHWDIADACKIAGENLRSAAVDCPEGNGSMGEPFAVICARTAMRRPLPLGCWSTARNAVEARGCGSLACVRK